MNQISITDGTISTSSDGFGSHVTEIRPEGGIAITNPGGMLEYNNGNFSIVDAAQNGPVFTVRGDGRVGFFGAVVIQQNFGASTAGITYGANEQQMLQKVYDALRAYGLGT